ncbi:phage/plasmid replication protein, II/X family [Terasakiella pusilla]|uniref:phage/plasmid replication protein, II/X family n=1 Tax=Terasakiella pusilla TaxID=64973 RepID=UPI003AA7C0F3
MIDWISARAPECFDGDLTGGSVMKITPDGEVEWVSHSKKRIEGSFQSSVMVRQLSVDHSKESIDVPGRAKRAHGCVFEGNPAKFLTGHNLFGSADCADLLTRSLEKVGQSIGQEPWPFDFGQADLTRIDLTANWLVDRPQDALPFLEAMQQRCHVPFRGRGVVPPSGPGTLYWGYKKPGERASPWQIKIYLKGLEVAKRPLHYEAMKIPGLLEELARTIRVEVTLRTPELKRLGMTRARDFTPESCKRVWEEYVGKIDFGEDHMTLDTTDLRELGLSPRLIDTVAAWKAGNDLARTRAPSTFRRQRKQIRDACGIDIATSVPTSNVIPLRRVVVAKPAQRPQWADTLTGLMREVA